MTHIFLFEDVFNGLLLVCSEESCIKLLYERLTNFVYAFDSVRYRLAGYTYRLAIERAATFSFYTLFGAIAEYSQSESLGLLDIGVEMNIFTAQLRKRKSFYPSGHTLQ